MTLAVSLLAAKVWTAWIAFPLLAMIILTLIAFAIGWVVKVISPRYPKR